MYRTGSILEAAVEGLLRKREYGIMSPVKN